MPHIAAQIADLGQLTELDATKRRLEAGSSELKKLTKASDLVRERLPATILHHYDLRISKGKRGAAKMRNNVCGGCYISIPSGQLADLLREDVTLQICGNCSIYILPGDPVPVAEVPVKAAKKPAVRKRKTKDAEPASE
jgi:predicted  nucleic acid-binding Zn-ribbon protein